MPIDVVADMCTENSHPWPWHDEWKSHRMWNRTGSLFELFVVDKKHIIYLVSPRFTINISMGLLVLSRDCFPLKALNKASQSISI